MNAVAPLFKYPAQADNAFVRDQCLGFGRFDPDDETLLFFDSPVTPQIAIPAGERQFSVALLPAQERVWWFDGDAWLVGRVDSPATESAEAYYVHFPNGRTDRVPAGELRVRWSVPLKDPLGLLQTGTVETQFFHRRRTDFLRSVMAQRSASLCLGGLLSSAVEIHEHQVGAAIRVLTDPVPRYLLADEVGLGKTIEAGMVLRQLLLDTPGRATILVPDHLVHQWEDELATKFRVSQLPGVVDVVGHSFIERLADERRMLTIVDEAHRFTDQVDYRRDGDRERRYSKLKEVAHSSDALLLLSATPVRSNEDAFLGLLHLLDPQTYRLEDVAAFRLRVGMRDDLAQAISAMGDETPTRYLKDPIEQVRALLPADPVVQDLVDQADRHLAERQESDARSVVNSLRIHLSETYRLHRRLIRNRRSSAVKRDFPVRGRNHAETWTIPDPDQRRAKLFSILETFRLDLEVAENLESGPPLQAVLGRALGPINALTDLARALRREPVNDLSETERTAITQLAGTPLGRDLAQRLDSLVSSESQTDRLTAMVEWARPHIGRNKVAVACSFPNAAAEAALLLTKEFGHHRVTALLEGYTDAQRSALAKAFVASSEQSILVMDRSVEEGANLQFIDEVLHLNVPTVSSQLEQRLGRFDRWSTISTPVLSVVFEERESVRSEHLDAWTRTLDEVFNAFRSSTATLQYVLADMETDFFTSAVELNLAGAARAAAAEKGNLDLQRRRIVGQDLLDSIEDRADDALLTKQLRQMDVHAKGIEKAVYGYVHEMLGFTSNYENECVRFGVSTRHPPIVTEATVQAIGTELLRSPYTSDRSYASSAGKGFLRWGEPLVSAFAALAERDDRGKAFVTEVRLRTNGPNREPMFAFCFDIKIAPGHELTSQAEADEALTRSTISRTARFLPTTIERIWWMAGRGGCSDEMVRQLESMEGENLGSRPARFRELTGGRDWPELCANTYGLSLSRVQSRERVRRRIDGARSRAASAGQREDAILRARSMAGAKDPTDTRVFEAVHRALANPEFTLESCGVVILTGEARA